MANAINKRGDVFGLRLLSVTAPNDIIFEFHVGLEQRKINTGVLPFGALRLWIMDSVCHSRC